METNWFFGVSGGPDSICMLDILYRMANNQIEHKIGEFDFVVVHLNHLIRQEAKADEEYVQHYCEEKKIKFYGKSIDVLKLANNNKIGTEEAGRIARYQFLEEIMEKTSSHKIAVAHNKNDKVETILMHLIRGSGIAGLKGIEAKRGEIIRPLIDCQREEIEAYCERRGLEPRIDKTNFDNRYTRNKIRNVVIPYLQQEFNPNIIETIDRLAKLVEEQENYIEKQVQKVYQNILVQEQIELGQIVLNLKSFNQQEKVIKARIILYTITRLFGNSSGIEKIHIEDIIKLCENNIGNKFLTPNKKIKVLVKNHQIYFMSQI